MKAAFQAHLNDEFEAGKEYRPNKADWLDGKWSHLDRMAQQKYQRGKTAIPAETFADVAKRPEHGRPKVSRCTKPLAGCWMPRPRCLKGHWH